MTPTQPPYKLQQWPAHLMVLVTAGVTLLTFVPPSATRQYTWPWSPLVLLAWLAPLLAVGGRMIFRNSWHWPAGLLRAGFTLLVATTLLSAALSPYAEHSLLRIWPTLAGSTLFFWLHDWLAETEPDHRRRVRLLAKGLAGFGALLTIVSLSAWIWRNQGVVWGSRNDYPFGHSIYTAGALVLVLPWLVLAAVKTQGARRVIWVGAALLAFGALLSTSSRGGVLATGAVATVTAGLLVARAHWSSAIKTTLVIVALLLIGTGVWSNPRLRELVRGQGWGLAAQESNVQRTAMIDAGLKLGAGRPLTGWGPGTVPLTYPQVRHRLDGGVDSVLQLHNSPAQVWATLGSPGLLAVLLLLVAVARRGWQVVRQGSAASPVTLAAATSLAGYGLFSLTDHQLDVPAMNTLLVLALALFFSENVAIPTATLTRATKRYLMLGAAFILIIPLLMTGRDLLARYAYDQSLILFDHGRPELGLRHLDLAAQRAPYDPYYRHQLAGRYLDQRDKAQDPAVRALLAAEATAQLQQSLAAGCLQEYAHFNLAWLALEANEPTPAIAHFLATVQEAPHRGGAYLGLGLAYRAGGNETAAVRAFALEWLNDPLAFANPLWEWPDFAPLRPAVMREAETLINELALTKPTALYVREFWRWWETGVPLPTSGFDRESDAFAQALAELAQGRPFPPESGGYAWGALGQYWQQTASPATRREIAGNDEAWAAALERRVTRHPPPDWRGFFTAGLENEPVFLTSLRYSRLGYGVLALHPDGPVLTNLYVHQQNRFVTTFAAGLLPPKGWLPARELLTRLPEHAASP